MTELAQRRDEAMNRRRLELGMTWRQVAAAAAISYETLRAVRKGDTAGGELTLSSIERALHWVPGAFASIDAGREPTPAQANTDARAALRESDAAASSSLPSRDVELMADIAAATAERLGLTQSEAEEAFRLALRGIEEKRAAEVQAEGNPEGRRGRRAG